MSDLFYGEAPLDAVDREARHDWIDEGYGLEHRVAYHRDGSPVTKDEL